MWKRHYLEPHQGQLLEQWIPPKPKWWRRHWKLLLGVVTVLLIAAIAGAIGTAVAQRSNDESSKAASPTSEGKNSMTGTAVAQSDYSFPTTISGGKGRLDVFGVKSTTTNTKWHKWYENESWGPSETEFELLSSQIKANTHIAALSRGFDSDRILDVVDTYVVGADDLAYEQFWMEKWLPSKTNSLRLGGGLSSSIEVISWSEDRYDLFALDTLKKLQQKTWLNESASDLWHRRELVGQDGGPSTYAFTPTATTSAHHRGDVFVVDEKRFEVFHTAWVAGGEIPILFENIGGYCTSRPSAVSKGSGRIDLFCRGGDAELWMCSYDSTKWGKWEALAKGKVMANEPHAISQTTGRIDVFVQTANDTIAVVSFDDSWTDSTRQGEWVDLGGEVSGPPKAVSWEDGRMDVFAYDRDGVLIHKYWEGTDSMEFKPDTWESIGSP